MDLTEAEDIKKRQKEYTEELYKKVLNLAHSPRADVLDCKIKWALEDITMNKASGDDGIPAELF